MACDMFKGVYIEIADTLLNCLEYVPAGTERIVRKVRSTPGTKAPNRFDETEVITVQPDGWERLLMEGAKLLEVADQG
jgi:hypothetical protein